MLIKQVIAVSGDLENIYSPGKALGGPNTANYGKLIGPLFQNILIVLGVISLITILLAGFNYLNSEGNEQKIETAQKMLTYAIIGIIVAASSFLILRIIGTILGFDFITGK